MKSWRIFSLFCDINHLFISHLLKVNIRITNPAADKDIFKIHGGIKSIMKFI